VVEEIKELDVVKELNLGEIQKAKLVKIEKGIRSDFFQGEAEFENASPEDKMVRLNFETLEQPVQDFFTTYALKVSPKSNLGRFLDRYKKVVVGMEVMAMRGGDGFLKVVI